jgi:phage terminase large subunit-like protein
MFLERLRPYSCYGGLDLAAVSDLTAFVLTWPIDVHVYVYPWFFLPEEGIAERSKQDNVRYDLWAEQGFLELTPGVVTDWRYVTTRIKQLAAIFDIRQVAFDRYGARDTVADLMEEGIEVVDVGQGFVSMNAPTKAVESLVLSRRLVHTGHPILRWNIDCATLDQDASGNVKPVKPHRLKSNKRIDGVVALAMSVSRVQAAENHTMNYTGLRSVG